MKFVKVIFLLLIITVVSCNQEPKIQQLKSNIDPAMELSHPLYFFETHDGISTVYEIPGKTKDMKIIFRNQENLVDIQCSKTSLYLLKTDRDGYMYIVRKETDFDILTESHPTVKLTPNINRPWRVNENDDVILNGKTSDNKNVLLHVKFSRKEPEESFKKGVVNLPEITWTESEFFSTSKHIDSFALERETPSVAITLSDSEKDVNTGLYFIDRPNELSNRISVLPVREIGDFSPNSKYLTVTLETEERIELFLVNTADKSLKQITSSPRGFISSKPRWQPDGNYIIYTVDFTTDFKFKSLSVEGEQLYLYSMLANKERRLTTFKGQKVWVDFAPNNDFLIYANTIGVAGRGSLDKKDSQAVNVKQVETWRVSFVPWKDETFISGNPNTLIPEDLRQLVSWTVSDVDKIVLRWGPG